jgi:SAM-dependent methyltransferase
MDAAVDYYDLDHHHAGASSAAMVVRSGLVRVFAVPPIELLEISDLIVDFDVLSLKRRPVDKSAVVEKLRTAGDLHAARIVAAMPEQNGLLDSEYVDRLLVRVHCEMQRLSEEFQHGRRVQELLTPMLAVLSKCGVAPPFRIVDIGCGTGYVIRWLAAHARFEQDVRLIGVDFNRALVDEARRLAALENLACRFEIANAFALEEPATVLLSTGVIHHFRGAGLTAFFRQHNQPGVQAFTHFDFQPHLFARPGAWLFHYIRMREPLSRHDGVVSARRAHTAETLLGASRQGAFACGIYSKRVWILPIPRVFHTLLGIRPAFVTAFRHALGPRIARLGPLQ